MEEIILAILFLLIGSVVGIFIIVNRVIKVINSLKGEEEDEDFEV